MPESKQPAEGLGKGQKTAKNTKGKSKQTNLNKSSNKNKFGKVQEDPNVLLKLPAGLKYKLPGKRQRVIVGSIVIGLNALLIIAVLLYLYNPGFQEFIYNVGRG